MVSTTLRFVRLDECNNDNIDGLATIDDDDDDDDDDGCVELSVDIPPLALSVAVAGLFQADISHLKDIVIVRWIGTDRWLLGYNTN
jgi:hypothetical protein